ncbi:unnamed protein product [Pylaiella littoralis]
MSGENTLLSREEIEEIGPPKTANTEKRAHRLRSYSCVEARPKGGTALTRLRVFARLPASCPYVGSFHYAPSAGNRAYSFFEDQIVPHNEALRLHKIKTNPMTGNFHSRPGVYSRLHGLQNFREGLVSLEEGATMDTIVARIRSSLTDSSTPSAAEVPTATSAAASSVTAAKTSSPNDNTATPKDGPTKDKTDAVKDKDAIFTNWVGGPPVLPAEVDSDGRPQLGTRARTLKGFRSRFPARDTLSTVSALKKAGKGEPEDEKTVAAARRTAAPYSKFWEEVDTERGRFGTSLDDNALPTSSSQQSSSTGSKSSAAGESMRSAAAAAGSHESGNSVHWGKHHHHHHHTDRSNESGGRDREGPGATAARLRQQYLLSARPNAAAAAQRARIQVTVAGGAGGPAAAVGAAAGATGTASGIGDMYRHGRSTSYGRGNTYGRGFRGVGGGNANGRGGRNVKGRGVSGPLLAHRSVPDAWVAAAAAAAEQNGAGAGGMRRSTSSSHGWESHTIQAQQKTNEYIQGREDLAPDMRPDVVLDNEVSLAYDVDMSEGGMLGAGAYGTVMAAVHRSTGRQVAIKTMLKKYLLTDAEKSSVEREIEIQKRLVNNHVIRLYEIYQSSEQIHLVVERAPCGTLEEFLYVRGRMTELDAKRVVRQLLDGLAYLHKSGVVHCDLKPANILFTDIDQGSDSVGGGGDRVEQPVTPRAQVQPPASLRGLVVKICDFGHARKVPDCRYYKFTRDINKIPFHMFKHTGTEGFVAPEVLRSEPYGKAADMWSTGCMINQMLTGRMPWIPSRACLQRPLSTSGPSWKNVSEPAKSLVEDLLTVDQDLRADVEQATNHSWFEGIHHCARMPTSAPGGKASPMLAPRRGRIASVPAVSLSARSLTPPRGEGVLGGDVAAGGGVGSSNDSPVKEEEEEAVEDASSSVDFVDEIPAAETKVPRNVGTTGTEISVVVL